MENTKEQLSAAVERSDMAADEKSAWQMIIDGLEAEQLAGALKDIKKNPKALRQYTDLIMKTKKAFEEGDLIAAEELFNDVMIETHIKNYRKALKFKLASWDLKRKLIREETGKE